MTAPEFEFLSGFRPEEIRFRVMLAAVCCACLWARQEADFVPIPERRLLFLFWAFAAFAFNRT